MLKRPYEELVRNPSLRPFRVAPCLIERLCEEEPIETRAIYRAAVHVLSISRNGSALRQALAINDRAFKAVSALVVRLMKENEGADVIRYGYELTPEFYLESYGQNRERTAHQVADMFSNALPDRPEFWMATTGERLIRFVEHVYDEMFKDEYMWLVWGFTSARYRNRTRPSS